MFGFDAPFGSFGLYPGNCLNAIQQVSAYTPEYAAYLEKLEREKFYRSASQNWLNAMLDIEIGA